MKKNLKIFLLLLGIIFLNATNLLAQKVYTIHVGNERLLIKLDSLTFYNKSAAQLGKVDSAFTKKMQVKIDSIQFRALERQNFVTQLKKINATTLAATLNRLEYDNLNNRVAEETKPLARDLAYTEMLGAILALADDFKNNKKVYYGTGKYQIPIELIPKAKEVFQPMTDQIIRFGNRYKDKPFDVVIETLAFSDGNQVERSSELYMDMANRLQSKNITQDELHTYISYLRAYDVSAMLAGLWRNRKSFLLKPENINIDYQRLGRGHLLTEQENLSFAPQKRNVVMVQWYILPKF